MRKTGREERIGGTVEDLQGRLPAATVSTTVRLPIDLAAYVNELVESGCAKDRTDSIIQCIQGHRERRDGVSHLTALTPNQLDVAEELGGIATHLQALQDEITLVRTRSTSELGLLRHDVQVLIAMHLYGDLGQEVRGSGETAPHLEQQHGGPNDEGMSPLAERSAGGSFQAAAVTRSPLRRSSTRG